MRTDNETLAGQMRRRVTRHSGGNEPVPSHKKNIVQALYNDYLCVKQLKEHRRNQVLHQAKCLVPTKRHSNQRVGRACRDHTHRSRHSKGDVHAPPTAAMITPPPPPRTERKNPARPSSEGSRNGRALKEQA